MSAILERRPTDPTPSPARSVSTGSAGPTSRTGDPSVLAGLTHALAQRSAQHDAEASFPHENFDTLHLHGVLASTVAAEFGGTGAGLVASRQVMAAVARGDAATALVLTMQFMQTRAVSRPDCRWPPALRRLVLDGAVRDGALSNALRVEPELGTPARGGLPATTLKRRPTAGACRATRSTAPASTA